MSGFLHRLIAWIEHGRRKEAYVARDARVLSPSALQEIDQLR